MLINKQVLGVLGSNMNLLKVSSNLNKSTKRWLQMGQKVSVNGINIHYERVGTGERNLLLLPGALGSTRTDFSLQLSGLNKDKFTLIAMDTPGYGYSRPPEKEYPDDFFRKDASLAAKFMETIGINKYSVLGWSYGSTLGLIMAAAHQTTVQKLVVFGSKVYICDEDRQLINNIKDLNKWSPEAKQPFIDLYGEQLFTQMWSSFVYHYCKVDKNYTKELKSITQKCLILHGDQDPMVAKEHPQYLLDNIKNASLYRFPKGRHNIHQRYAEEFNKIVEQFLLQD